MAKATREPRLGGCDRRISIAEVLPDSVHTNDDEGALEFTIMQPYHIQIRLYSLHTHSACVSDEGNYSGLLRRMSQSGFHSTRDDGRLSPYAAFTAIGARAARCMESFCMSTSALASLRLGFELSHASS